MAEIEGQSHITQTLDNAIKQGKISHAYLFTGPRGVGKTSIARILAHEVNGLDYSDESIHLDIIEIDAASNRRIDEIRDLRDKVHIAPTSAKYKVYIIDEVHMLTREAFNALLKTLEEPPAHVIFILATTELHKLPETIISRTQRFTFKPIENDVAVQHLAKIAKAEDIKIDKEALQLLAEHGKGSFRDSISLLDQIGHSDSQITADDVRLIIGLASQEHVQRTLDAVFQGTTKDLVDAINSFIAAGVSAAQAAKQLSSLLREQIINDNVNETSLALLGDLLAVSQSSEPTTALEIALFKAHIVAQPESKTTPKPKLVTKSPQKTTKPAVEEPAEIEIEVPVQEQPEPVAPEQAPVVTGESAEWWGDVLNQIKAVNNTLYGILRMAEPKVNGDTLHLSFGFGFHKKKVADSDTQAKIHEAIKKVTGSSYQIKAIHDKNITQQPAAKTKKPEPVIEEAVNEELESITNVFGGGEVLES